MSTSRPDPSKGASTGALVAWAFYDWANSSYATVIQTFVFAAYFARQIAPDPNTGFSQWGLATGIAGGFIALLGPILGAVVDQGGRRKPWIGALTLGCIVATAALWWMKPSASYLIWTMVLVGASTVCIELAAVFYNAMLPGLARRERLGRWSGWGWGLGYAGGVVSMLLCYLLFVQRDAWIALDRGDSAHVRATALLVAVWFLVFSLPMFLFTPDTVGKRKPIARAIPDGLRQLLHSIREARRYRFLVQFLIARLLYVDGLATLFAFGGVYAATTFNMTEQEVLLFGLSLNLTAGLGAFGFGWLDDRLGGKRTIILSLLGLLASAAVVLSVSSTALFWSFGMVLGIFVGPAQAASRSYLSRMAPEEVRNEIFGLYALSGKATAFAGPLLVAAVASASHSQRAGMSVILAFWLVGLLLMLTVKDDRGRA